VVERNVANAPSLTTDVRQDGMKKITIILLALFICGCATETRLQDDSQLTRLVGTTCRLPEQSLLARSGRCYYIAADRAGYSQIQLTPHERPTFAEFEDGTWANQDSHTGRFEYLAILPKGQIVEVTDILIEKHVETGVTYRLLGKLLGHGLSERAKPIVLNVAPKKIDLLKINGDWGFVRRQ